MLKLRKTRETICVTRHRAVVEMMAALHRPCEIYERPLSTHFPEAGVLYVASRKKTRKG